MIHELQKTLLAGALLAIGCFGTTVVGHSKGEATHSITPRQADKVRYSNQCFVYLDCNETFPFRLKDGTTKEIRLKSVQETQDRVIGLTRRAVIEVEVDGKPLQLVCSPYGMPTEFEGLRIQADTTSAWLAIPKRVQFSLWDATEPIVNTQLFCFPLPEYRLFSHGIQAYNEPVHLGYRDGDPAGQSFYHNYGVDFAGYEGRQKVVSCIDGVVIEIDRDEGTLCIQDSHDFILVFCHLDSILSTIRRGASVQRGQWVGMVGKRGASGNFSHLHVGSYLSKEEMLGGQMNRNLNLYPWLVTAYQEESNDNHFAVARPHHTVQAGETVAFDGSHSLVQGLGTVSFRWQFHDGTSMVGTNVNKVYDQPGCYMAALWIANDQGTIDVDFCKVKVYSHGTPEDFIPTLFITFKPAGMIQAGQPVNFRIWPQGEGTGPIAIDFGDVEQVEHYRPYTSITHLFKKPGIHIVTASTTFRGLPVTQQVKVLVRGISDM